MADYAYPIARLIDELSRLPGVGKKTAVRLAYHVLRMKDADVRSLSESLIYAKEKIKLCKVCCNFTDDDICSICSDSRRNDSIICVVETPKDLMAIEQGGTYKGLYHVLHGTLSPMESVGPENLKLAELKIRLTPEISEVVIATNATVEGEATADLVSSAVKESGIKVTRIAYGVPVGGDLEYFDSMTLKLAMDNRIEI